MLLFKKVMKILLCVKGYYQNNDFIHYNTPWKRTFLEVSLSQMIKVIKKISKFYLLLFTEKKTITDVYI